jgi:rhodanese-related sulfurtransferase
MKSDPPNLPWCQVAAILAAATVLGLAYNQASPLGVRAAKVSPIVSSPGFTNETVSLTLESGEGMPAPQVPTAAVRQIPNLTWAQVQPLLAAGKVVLVDARAKATYELGHIPGAVSLPSNSSAAEFQAFAKAHPPTTAVVSYCGSESCHASRQTLDALIRVGGFTQASDMPGGYAEFLATPAPAKP